tara:strand:- start:1112 stop:1399 length:288 start_codon:yes stop_codon:yes gene_type:complete
MNCKTCVSFDENNTELDESIQVFKNGIEHIKLSCSNCGSFVGWKPQNKPLVMPFGKYKGFKLENIPRFYLLYLLENATINKNLRKRINNFLDKIK